MSLAAALIYWVIISLWLAVLATVLVAFFRNPSAFATVRLLLIVVAIDTVRNIIENLYFGVYFGAQYGLFPSAIVAVLGKPGLLILPKLLNVVAAAAVLGLLLMRWLPMALHEKAQADADSRSKSKALSQESEERRRLFETSLDLILITDRQGNLIRVSPSCQSILGYAPSEMTGRSAGEFIYPDDLQATRQEMRQARAGRHTTNFESRYFHKKGQVVDLAWSGVWSEPEQKHFFFGRDTTERKAAEEKLRQLAHYDQLTGLANRVTLRQDLGALLTAGRPTIIAVLDLDGFKDINDTLGHATGDRLLQDVASRLTALIGDKACVYRLGGDEFVLSLPDCNDARAAGELVEATLKRLGERFMVKGQGLFVGASAGIAGAPADGTDVDELISNADLALYDAKASGGRTLRVYVPSLRARAQARHELGTELRRALEDAEFVLHFQPQVRVSDGAMVGAEALLRWQHPERGLLGPASFIDALADSPVAQDAGRWILRTACMCAASWHAQGHDVRVGVNLFPAQFRDGSLLHDVESALRDSGLPPAALELEITEKIALGNDEATVAQLQVLRLRGVGLAFDDFGTGYASLSYLTRYPLSRIKIDKSFVQKITERADPEETAIVRSIIVMAHNLGLEAIAEGVETTGQAVFLKGQQCDEVQGFLHSRPLPLDRFEEFMRANEAVRFAGRQALTA